MGYNFFDHKTTFFWIFPRIYSAGEKCFVLLTAHKGINQRYTVSFENIVKEEHPFRVIKNVGNREIARFTGLVQNSSGQMDFCRSLVLDKCLQ